MKAVSFVGAMLLVAVPAFAYVGVTPRESKYADGMSSDWVGPSGSRAPAPVTKLMPGGGR